MLCACVHLCVTFLRTGRTSGKIKNAKDDVLLYWIWYLQSNDTIAKIVIRYQTLFQLFFNCNLWSNTFSRSNIWSVTISETVRASIKSTARFLKRFWYLLFNDAFAKVLLRNLDLLFRSSSWNVNFSETVRTNAKRMQWTINYTFWYLPSKDTIAKVVSLDLDLCFQGQKFVERFFILIFSIEGQHCESCHGKIFETLTLAQKYIEGFLYIFIFAF